MIIRPFEKFSFLTKNFVHSSTTISLEFLTASAMFENFPQLVRVCVFFFCYFLQVVDFFLFQFQIHLAKWKTIKKL